MPTRFLECTYCGWRYPSVLEMGVQYDRMKCGLCGATMILDPDYEEWEDEYEKYEDA